MAKASKLEALLAIGKLVAPGSKSLASEVTLAFEDPAAYAKKFAKRMDARSIGKPPKNLPWIALIDSLDEAGALAEVDHREDTVDVKRAIDGLRGLGKSKERWKWLKAFSEEDLEDMDLAELLEHVGSHLGAEGVVLAQLDMDSDAFPLVVVAKKDAKRLVELGEAAGYGDVDLFTGSDLAAMQRARKGREAKRRTEQAAPAVNNTRSFIREQDGGTIAWVVLPYGPSIDVTTGVLGHDLETTTLKLDSPAAAVSEAKRLIALHQSEGYREIPLEECQTRHAAEAARVEAMTPAKGKPAKPKPARKK